ncbi:MAG: DUF3048 domain-containing protein [Thermoleophilia bacterium]|nr:DUF3048 domain-containing protein [Thermoleophilia bacterium]
MPSRYDHKSDSGRSRWITIGLVALIAAAAAFVAWAVYATRGDEIARQLKSITVIDLPVPQFNCPLDGTVVSSRSEARQRPVMVQIDNSPAGRPQSGLSQADIVYEAMAEGNVTRFSAIYACRDAEVVGPVRSARMINMELTPQYNALLATSGASNRVTSELEARTDIIPNIVHHNYAGAFYRTGDRSAPHNLMTSTAAVREAAAAAGFPVTADLRSLAFKDDEPAPAVQSIGIPYSSINNVSYQYDPGSNGWLRSINGVPHIDALTGGQLMPKNVIIQYVNTSVDPIVDDVGGSPGQLFDLIGTGPVQIFRDGLMIDGSWQRESLGEMTTYVDAAGQPIPLNRGLTFVQLVSMNFQPSVG